MSITVTLSEQLSEQLQSQADQSHLSLDALVEKLLADALPVVQSTNLHHSSDVTPAEDDDSESSLARVIAQIKATTPNTNAIHSATKSIDELIADLQANSPS